MVFNAYPTDELQYVSRFHRDMSAFHTANRLGIAYGILKTETLIISGFALYQKPTDLVIISLLSSGFLCLTAAAIAAVADKRAEYRYEEIRKVHLSEAKERVAKANWVSIWTCYSLAAMLYGKPTMRLACQDMKILAIRITKIAAGIGSGLLLLWFIQKAQYTSENVPWNHKATVGASILACSCIAFIFMHLHRTLPNITSRSRILLDDAIENCPKPNVPVAPGNQEMTPLHPQLIR